MSFAVSWDVILKLTSCFVLSVAREYPQGDQTQQVVEAGGGATRAVPVPASSIPQHTGRTSSPSCTEQVFSGLKALTFQHRGGCSSSTAAKWWCAGFPEEENRKREKQSGCYKEIRQKNDVFLWQGSIWQAGNWLGSSPPDSLPVTDNMWALRSVAHPFCPSFLFCRADTNHITACVVEMDE